MSAPEYPLTGDIPYLYRFEIYIIAGNQVHFNALIAAGQRFLSCVLSVDMPEIAIRHFIFH